jgi:hypothetical protein
MKKCSRCCALAWAPVVAACTAIGPAMWDERAGGGRAKGEAGAGPNHYANLRD